MPPRPHRWGIVPFFQNRFAPMTVNLALLARSATVRISVRPIFSLPAPYMQAPIYRYALGRAAFVSSKWTREDG